MSLQILTNTTKVNYNAASEKSFSGDIHSGSAWKNPNAPQKVSDGLKAGVFLTTLAGVASALAIMLKIKGYKLNGTGILKGLKEVDYKEREIIALAASSIAGGLAGGALFDKKEHFNAKLRESVIQFVGNVLTPLLCVSFGVRTFRSYLDKKAQKITPELKLDVNPKIVSEANKAAKSVPLVVATGLSLLVGIWLGNKVGNLLNEKVCKVKDNRKLKATDMSPHIDDACLAISLAESGKSIGHYIARIIPAALMVAGYSTGVAQEKPERCNHCPE